MLSRHAPPCQAATADGNGSESASTKSRWFRALLIDRWWRSTRGSASNWVAAGIDVRRPPLSHVTAGRDGGSGGGLASGDPRR